MHLNFCRYSHNPYLTNRVILHWSDKRLSQFITSALKDFLLFQTGRQQLSTAVRLLLTPIWAWNINRISTVNHTWKLLWFLFLAFGSIKGYVKFYLKFTPDKQALNHKKAVRRILEPTTNSNLTSYWHRNPYKSLSSDLIPRPWTAKLVEGACENTKEHHALQGRFWVENV